MNSTRWLDDGDGVDDHYDEGDDDDGDYDGDGVDDHDDDGNHDGVGVVADDNVDQHDDASSIDCSSDVESCDCM